MSCAIAALHIHGKMSDFAGQLAPIGQISGPAQYEVLTFRHGRRTRLWPMVNERICEFAGTTSAQFSSELHRSGHLAQWPPIVQWPHAVREVRWTAATRKTYNYNDRSILGWNGRHWVGLGPNTSNRTSHGEGAPPTEPTRCSFFEFQRCRHFRFYSSSRYLYRCTHLLPRPNKTWSQRSTV